MSGAAIGAAREENMVHKGLFAALAVAAATATATAGAAAEELRIGYVVTLSGGAAIIGQHSSNGFRLGLEHEGWKVDGDKLAGQIPARVFFADDQLKVEVALREVDRFLKQHKVHVVAGLQWSNIQMAAFPIIAEAKIPAVGTVAGASPLSGAQCSPYLSVSSWNNDQLPEATGILLNNDGVKNVYALVPNYQAGKDMIVGLERTYKGAIVDRAFFKLGETDFQAEISKLRAKKPAAVFFFGPGAMGISFFKQWAASGAGTEIRIYSVFTADEITVPAIGEAAVGSLLTNFWDPASTAPANQRFMKEYTARFGHKPSLFAVAGYDGARMIGGAVRALKGKIDDGLAFARAIRKAEFASPRGTFKMNANGFPIQDFFKQEIVRSAGGVDIATRGLVMREHKDAYWEQCPPDRRH
jgi:branched-chain amino acid transport system substrate-binding protein